MWRQTQDDIVFGARKEDEIVFLAGNEDEIDFLAGNCFSKYHKYNFPTTNSNFFDKMESLAIDYNVDLSKTHYKSFEGTTKSFFTAGGSIAMSVKYFPGNQLSKYGLVEREYNLRTITLGTEKWTETLGKIYTLHENMDLNEINQEMNDAVKKMGREQRNNTRKRQLEIEEEKLMERVKEIQRLKEAEEDKTSPGSASKGINS